MTRTIEDNTDLSALFGIEFDAGVDATHPANIDGLICDKCHGSGSFTGRNGKVIGKCFACDGSGLGRIAGKTLAADDCTKCAGTGEWRPGRPCFACNGKGKEIVGTEITVEAIEKAFATAKMNGIKSPKLRLDTFQFSMAPLTGRNAGSLYVKDGGEYIGKVTDGKFRPSMACDDATKARVIEVASKPHDAARAYGARTGSCSCCGRELTKGISIDLGIGPICQEKYGW